MDLVRVNMELVITKTASMSTHMLKIRTLSHLIMSPLLRMSNSHLRLCQHHQINSTIS